MKAGGISSVITWAVPYESSTYSSKAFINKHTLQFCKHVYFTYYSKTPNQQRTLQDERQWNT